MLSSLLLNGQATSIAGTPFDSGARENISLSTRKRLLYNEIRHLPTAQDVRRSCARSGKNPRGGKNWVNPWKKKKKSIHLCTPPLCFIRLPHLNATPTSMHLRLARAWQMSRGLPLFSFFLRLFLLHLHTSWVYGRANYLSRACYITFS